MGSNSFTANYPLQYLYYLKFITNSYSNEPVVVVTLLHVLHIVMKQHHKTSLLDATVLLMEVFFFIALIQSALQGSRVLLYQVGSKRIDNTQL